MTDNPDKIDRRKESRDLEQQLADSQADRLRLIAVLKSYDGSRALDQWDENVMPSREWEKQRSNALSTPTGDLSALRELIAQAFDEWAGYDESEAVDKLRSGEWTPECLK
jgi:hypothetical protein